jgi:mevalonate kinase
MDKNSFYSKILLFGEYGIMLNSDALSIPFKKFSGYLQKSILVSNEQRISNKKLIELYDYIIKNESLSEIINFQIFKNDIDSGLYFNSNIPIASGLGSSGALVSSIINKYSKIDLSSIQNEELKKIMSIIESKFHGNSSGFDPLVSFFNKPIMLSAGNIKLLNDLKFPNFKIYLVDSKISSSTLEMIKIFNQKISQEDFLSSYNSSFIKTTNECIYNLMYDSDNFKDSIKNLSEITFKNMNEMIPESLKEIWQEGLKSNKYYMKLCGSGGGGFFLAFDFGNNLKYRLSEFNLIEI